MDLSLDSGRMKNYNVVVTIYGYCEVIQSNNSAQISGIKKVEAHNIADLKFVIQDPGYHV